MMKKKDKRCTSEKQAKMSQRSASNDLGVDDKNANGEIIAELSSLVSTTSKEKEKMKTNYHSLQYTFCP
jgi:hypothetical protein